MKTDAINTNLSEEMIDEIVESQINDDFAWGKTIEVTQKHLVLEIPDKLDNWVDNYFSSRRVGIAHLTNIKLTKNYV